MSEQGSVEAGQKAYLANSAVVNFGMPPSVASLCTVDQLRQLHYINDLRLPYPRHRPGSTQAYSELLEWISERLNVDKETLSFSHPRVIRDHAKRALAREFDKLRTYGTPNLASARARAAAAYAARMHAHTPQTLALRHLIPEAQRQLHSVTHPEPARRPHVANVRSLAAAADALTAGAVGEVATGADAGTFGATGADMGGGRAAAVSTARGVVYRRTAATAASPRRGSTMRRPSLRDAQTPWAVSTPGSLSSGTRWQQGYRSWRGAGGVALNHGTSARFSQDFREDRGRAGQQRVPYSPWYSIGYQYSKGTYHSSYWNPRGYSRQGRTYAGDGYLRGNISRYAL
jgi:hypothetical protein